MKVELRTEGHRVVLTLDNSEQVTFALSRSNIQAILDGETIQVSHKGIFCKMTRVDSAIQVYFAWKTRHEHVSCSAGELEMLIAGMEEKAKEA